MIKSAGKVIGRNLSEDAIKAHLILLARFYSRFGIIHGVKLFFKFKFRRLQKIKLPDIKFPFRLRPGTSDINSFNQIFLDDSYQFQYNDIKPKVIIDAGANIGLFSIKLKNLFPDVTIICLEPDRDNFEVLSDNLSKYKDIYPENCALWGSNTSGNIQDKYNLGKWGMVVEENIENGSIPFVTISDLMKKYNIDEIDILKIDIETSEKNVFANPSIDWLPKVKVLIVELHDWLEPGCASIFFKAINSALTNYTYLIRGDNTIIINTKKHSEHFV